MLRGGGGAAATRAERAAAAPAAASGDENDQSGASGAGAGAAADPALDWWRSRGIEVVGKPSRAAASSALARAALPRAGDANAPPPPARHSLTGAKESAQVLTAPPSPEFVTASIEHLREVRS
jgi:hypothetical protein